jgi:oxalate decarboxylase/phosphoglucose isomerase-like protein (cupin superfamily)
MHPVLQLHYQIQRRTHVETRMVIAAVLGLSLFFTMSCFLYTRIDDNNVVVSMDSYDAGSTNNNNNNVQQQQRLLQQPLLRRKGRSALQKQPQYYSYTPNASVTTLRQAFEREHAAVTDTDMLEYIAALRTPDPATDPVMDYDIYNCPVHAPPLHYPVAWNAMTTVLRHWNPDHTVLPSNGRIYQSVCVFDWTNAEHRDIAVPTYRAMELPFVLRNHPEVVRTAYRWSSSSQPDYLQQLLGDDTHRNEHSVNNHFMFWRLSAAAQQQQQQRGGGARKPFQPPTDNVPLSFAEWLKHAQQLERMTDEEQVGAEHWYFRLNAALPNTNTFLYDELPFFQPHSNKNNVNTNTTSLFMVDSTQQRGINCRFGMKGVIAEAHFDPTRNWIVLLQGRRRYILAHPEQCAHLELYPYRHPSGRHSAVDWSTIAVVAANKNATAYTGPFQRAAVHELVLQGGDALYLPTSWFHYIVSLNTNYQCNARSGVTMEHRRAIQRCGFDV